MKWKDLLKNEEKVEMDSLDVTRKSASAAYNDFYRKLKSRCESRMRQINKKLNER